MFKPHAKLGEILIQEGLITQAQLKEALDKQKTMPNVPIGEVLVELGIISEDTLVEFLGKQFNLPYINKTKELLVPEQDVIAAEIISRELIEQYKVLPLSKKGTMLKVALSDPLNLMLLDNLKVITGLDIEPVIVGKTLLNEAINDFIRQKNITEQISEKEVEKEESINLDKVMAEAAEGQVVRVVNLIIIQAVSDGASDIHIEPTDQGVQLRYRIDGELTFVSPPPPKLYNAIVSRIKILSRLDISEKRLPQDGAITMKVEGRDIDMRVSTIPSIYGEKVVIRILDKGKLALDIDTLGVDEHSLNDFKNALAKPYGLMLVTGPTGSGKTTTLYACLNYLNSPNKNLNTIEDPVEYKLRGVNQIQVRPDIGLTFAAGLRSFLRQDPDIIMVGEIRDAETAEICVRSALTGHFVLSTLHTNNAVLSIDRLINIGIEPILIISSMVLIVAQRLVRRLCPECREAYSPSQALIDEFGFSKNDKLFRPRGCAKCKNLGYKGRIAIHETLVIDEELKNMIVKRTPANILEAKAIENGMKTLRMCGVEKVKQGLTSLEEVIAMTV